MPYTALYRKWRPGTFGEVKGQDAIVTTLKNQIRTGRIGHAYLFCGTRGTGKTTVAKILARAVNCEHPVDGAPCGTCDTCRAIQAGSSMNVVEIDGASNNGVDSIREIREQVQYPPTEGRFRVYIIDEAHMITREAFNALLKTLEEPPSYIIFILATTEPNKIPVTVISRCQRYDFKRMTTDVIRERLGELAEYENIDVEEKALRYIARKADGAMRDAISLFDQCIGYYIGETLTYEKVLGVLGAVDGEVFSRFFRALTEAQVTSCLEQIDELVLSGRELSQYVQDFVWYLRNLLLISSADVSSEMLDLTEEDLRRMREEAQMTDANGLMRLIRSFSELYNRMRYAANRRVLLEIAVIRAAQPEMEEDLESLRERVRRLEEKVKKGIPAAPAARTSAPEPAQEAEAEPVSIALPAAQYEDLMSVRREWDAMISELLAEDYPSGVCLNGSRPEPRQDGTLSVVFFNQDHYNNSRAMGALSALQAKVSGRLGKQVELEARLELNPGPEPVYSIITDEDLSNFRMPVEIEDSDDDEDESLMP